MADGKNDARTLRVREIANDVRTLELHNRSIFDKSEISPPTSADQNLIGYRLLQQTREESKSLVSLNTIDLNVTSPDNEVEKAKLQRLMLDLSARRHQAFKVHLRAAAGLRWVQLRLQISNENYDAPQKKEALTAIDTRLQNELEMITDEHVVSENRSADEQKNCWLGEDPSLNRILAWIRRRS